MQGRWSVGWAVSMVFLLIIGPGGVGRACAASLSRPGLAQYSRLLEPAGVAAREFGNAVLIDEQQGRYGQAETGLDVHYNRVDGLFVQLGVDTRWKAPTKIRLFAWGGYAFAGEAWRYEIGLNRWIELGPIRSEVEVRNYDLTYTDEEWLMPTYENSAAAFFFREDFRDYYRRSGSSFHLINTLSRRLRLELAYLLDEHETLKKETDWSLFGGDKKFRGNPAADGGEVHSMVAQLGYDTRDDFLEPSSGFWVDAVYEKGGNQFGGDYGFQRFVLDLRRYLALSRFENIDLRLRTGTASGNLPVQKAYDLGGIGSLRGYKFKEFKDLDRMVLGNIDYRIQFGRFAPSSLEDKQIIPFYDFGFAWSSNDKGSLWAGFDQLKWNRLKTSVGIGFSTGSDDGLRVNLARRLDDRDRSMEVTVRIHRIF